MKTLLTPADRAAIRNRARILQETAVKVAEQNDRARNAADDANAEAYVAKHIELSTFEASVIAYDVERLLGETEPETDGKESA